MKSQLESLCHLVLQQLAAEPQIVQQLAAEPQFVQQLLARLQPGHGEHADARGLHPQVLLDAGEDRRIRVHFGDGDRGTPLESAFSLRLFGGPGEGVCELDGTAAVDVLIRPDGGEVRYQGQVLAGGVQRSPGAGEWCDGVVSYFCFDAGERRQLLVMAGASALFVQDWRHGDLGIRLRTAEAAVSAQPARAACS